MRPEHAAAHLLLKARSICLVFGRGLRCGMVSWLTFVLRPAWSNRLNAISEDHAKHEYATLVSGNYSAGSAGDGGHPGVAVVQHA